MKLFIALFCIASLAALCQANPVSYEGYRVYRVHMTTEEEFQKVYELFNSSHPLVRILQLAHYDLHADVLVAPTFVDEFCNYLDLLNGNFQNLIDQQNQH